MWVDIADIIKLNSNAFVTLVLTKLEIWGKAQRESARRPKSDWGKLERGE